MNQVGKRSTTTEDDLQRRGESGLSQPRRFTGQLLHDEDHVEVAVQISLDETGEVVFAFEPIPRTDASFFLLDAAFDRGERLAQVRLSAATDDGIRFETDDFRIERCSFKSNDDREQFDVSGSCLTGTFRRPLAAFAPLPVLRLQLRGYQGFGSHGAFCPVGQVVIAAHRDNARPNALTGSIALRPTAEPDDFAKWREHGERLLEHVRRVMSFAASSHLRTPILECYHGDEVQVKIWSQTTQATAALPTIHRMQHDEIFATAVRSFFSPPIAVRQLFHAIEWFTMETTYNEIRLMCAMTALENLLNANLTQPDVEIQQPKAFEKNRTMLRRVIRRCLETWPAEKAGEVLHELNGKLGDLNRRSFHRKLNILAARWGVPLGDIPDGSLMAAIRARDRVVHRGNYYEERREEDPDLWTHVTLVREVVVRFVFTAIGYSGDYISYVAGARHAKFPPARS